MVTVQQTDTVWSDETGTILFTDVKDSLLKDGTSLCLLAETCRDDDECPYALVACQQFCRVGAELGRYDEDCQFSRRQFLYVVKHLDALHYVLFGVDDAQCTFITAHEQVAYDGTARLMLVVGPADNDNALRVK